MSLKKKLEKLKDAVSNHLSRDNILRLQHSVDQIKAEGLAERALGVGDRAPDFTLEDTTGRPVSLQELIASGPLVLTFYRGVW